MIYAVITGYLYAGKSTLTNVTFAGRMLDYNSHSGGASDRYAGHSIAGDRWSIGSAAGHGNSLAGGSW